MSKYKNLVEKLRKIEEKARNLVDERIKEFKNLGLYGTELDLFSELSFCVLTANWSAHGGIKAQNLIGKNNFSQLPLEDLIKELEKVGHRYARKRGEYIFENRKLIGKLKDILDFPSKRARKILVESAKGIGWKEASHFLRNTGKFDVAILDKHILRILHAEKIIEEIPKNWTEKKYLYIENFFFELSQEFGKNPGETDLYIWYLIKGKVEK
ncbi:MAG: N-glycosylase/DNA lyase [Dictyoglomaceae bacterium]|nr:N-glycosylase/DNA lyase [Dictyoglomaceae bacterium]